MRYAEIVLEKLVFGSMTTYNIMNIPLKGGGSILRPAAVIEDLRNGTKDRPKFDVHMNPVGKAGMALYFLTQADKVRARKFLGISHSYKRAA